MAYFRVTSIEIQGSFSSLIDAPQTCRRRLTAGATPDQQDDKGDKIGDHIQKEWRDLHSAGLQEELKCHSGTEE
jgi:hypothetical protein